MIETLTQEGAQIRGDGESLQLKQVPDSLGIFPREAGSIAVRRTVYPPNWREMGRCTEPGTDPELFFPVGTGEPAILQAEQAKSIYCANCSVQEACLVTALKAKNDGVWGNTTEQERREIPQDARDALNARVIVL